MSFALDILTITAVSAGAFFFLAGTVGLLRFPDALTRLHALTKADNLGLGLVVLGLLPQAGSLRGGLKLICVWLLVLLAGSGAARAQESQEGYYYPKPEVVETYQARVATLPDSDRSRRLGFVTALSKEFDARPYPPNYLVFAKGDDADKLIITGMIDGQFNTVFRTRALLADLTASARLTDFFQKNAIAEYATFLDFLKLLGFKEVTVTDGATFAQQIKIQ